MENPASRPHLVDLFQHFVRHFEQHMNQLRLVELAVKASQQITGAPSSPCPRTCGC